MAFVSRLIKLNLQHIRKWLISQTTLCKVALGNAANEACCVILEWKVFVFSIDFEIHFRRALDWNSLLYSCACVWNGVLFFVLSVVCQWGKFEAQGSQFKLQMWGKLHVRLMFLFQFSSTLQTLLQARSFWYIKKRNRLSKNKNVSWAPSRWTVRLPKKCWENDWFFDCRFCQMFLCNTERCLQKTVTVIFSVQ